MTTKYRLFKLTDPEVANRLELAVGTVLVIMGIDKQYYFVANLNAAPPANKIYDWWWVQRNIGEQIPGEFTEAELEVVKLLYGD